MNSFQFNKYAMAILGSVFVIMSISLLSESLFHSQAPEQAGYIIETAVAQTKPAMPTPATEAPAAATEAPAAGTAAPATPAEVANTLPYEPVSSLLANADLAAGKKVFKKCAACHTADKGGKKKIGPNIFDIIGKPAAASEGFKYSAAMKAFADSGKTWTYEELNGFLFKPKLLIKGTKMGFAGVKKTADRANLIGWLRMQADSPQPLPGT